MNDVYKIKLLEQLLDSDVSIGRVEVTDGYPVSIELVASNPNSVAKAKRDAEVEAKIRAKEKKKDEILGTIVDGFIEYLDLEGMLDKNAITEADRMDILNDLKDFSAAEKRATKGLRAHPVQKMYNIPNEYSMSFKITDDDENFFDDGAKKASKASQKGFANINSPIDEYLKNLGKKN